MAAEREDAGRFIVHADEKLTAFLELESAISGREHRTQLLRTRLSNPICAARQSSQAKHNRAKKLLSRHRERPPR